MVKKIGILTLPMGMNVGGVLQAFALNRVVSEMGYDVETLKNYTDRRFSTPIIRLYRIFTEYYQRKFIRRNICRSKIVIRDMAGFEKVRNVYDVLITGSDQVWRDGCTKEYYYYYYLVFSGESIRKIAYAASFGIGQDEWKWDTERIEKLKLAMSNFTGVSVREKSGVDICRHFYNGKVYHVLDPTMLLSCDTYRALCNNWLKKKQNLKNFLFAYILDDEAGKTHIVQDCAETLSLTIFSISQRKKIKNLFLLKDFNISHYMFPSVEYWLAKLGSADFVVTDSFHGVVFSILFNKQFIAIANKDRGKERFDSLLQMFGLQDRLINDYEDYKRHNWSMIKYDAVNDILMHERKKSLTFLKSCLKDE